MNVKLYLPFALLLTAVHAFGALNADGILDKMDESSAAFRGMQADLRWVTYTALVDDTSVETGDIWVRRDAAGEVDLKISFDEPARRDLLVDGTQVQMYQPKINQVSEYDLSKNKDQLEQALLVGFGVSGKFLRENYEVEFGGEETVGEQLAVKLNLTPKENTGSSSLKKLEMWVSTTTWQPVQQKLDQGDGDYRLYSYSRIEINPGLKNADFKLDLPKKVKRVKQ